MRVSDPVQMDLLSWVPPRTIVPFPLSARVGEARAVARILDQRKSLSSRERYWAKTIDALEQELRRHGASVSEIDAQLKGFRFAVIDELERKSGQRTPGDAA